MSLKDVLSGDTGLLIGAYVCKGHMTHHYVSSAAWQGCESAACMQLAAVWMHEQDKERQQKSHCLTAAFAVESGPHTNVQYVAHTLSTRFSGHLGPKSLDGQAAPDPRQPEQQDLADARQQNGT